MALLKITMYLTALAYLAGKIWNKYLADTNHIPNIYLSWAYTTINWIFIIGAVLACLHYISNILLYEEYDDVPAHTIRKRNTSNEAIKIIIYAGIAYFLYISWEKEWVSSTLLIPLYVIFEPILAAK